MSSHLDTIDLAELTKRSYAEHYVAAGKPRVLRDVIDRYEETDPGSSLDEAVTEFTRTRGPYLQALDLPRRGPDWESFADDVGLHEDVMRTFRAAGFEYLYEFQAETIRSVIEGDHTLVTAGTGRGKTESWLIPILQYITEAKAGEHPDHPPQSVKCVLTYPTKALAQDQLKRLIEYLYELNRNRTGADRITIGIFDGDTPNNDASEYEYLKTAYQFFECPCEHCDASLTVERTEDERFRVDHNAPKAPEIDLDFIRLTRDEVVEEEVDILLTNPDTINYRLFNVNQADEQAVFVEEPRFIVFDEIHEYAELFGAFTATLMRRYIRARQALRGHETLDDDDLQVVGASATVANRRAIFNRVLPFTDPETAVVTEDPQTLDAPTPSAVPDVFRTEKLDVPAFIEALGDGNDPGPVGQFLREFVDIDLPPDTDAETVRTLIQESLYERLLSDSGDDLDIIRALYATLYDDAQTPAELTETIEDALAVDADTAETVRENFVAIGRLAGVLESRVHLFSWPIDGYYTCLNCATVYGTPQSQCQSCDHHFVTKFAYCSHCGEEALESWFCPACERLEPLTVTSEQGQFEYFNTQVCRCDAGAESETEMIRTLWRPFYTCSECGDRQQLDRVRECSTCNTGAPMTLTVDREAYECTNPTCDGREQATRAHECQSCSHEALDPLAEDTLYCVECDETYPETDGERCTCGGALLPKRFLGWQCSGTDCDEVYLGEPPNTCDCGKRRFARTALFDLNRVEECNSCGRELFPGKECFCDDPDTNTRVTGFKNFQMVDERGQVRNASDFPGAVPCYDKGRSYSKTHRYESMLRGPGNAAVTSSQYQLRAITNPDNPETFQEAKLLSFADSQSDMKELARDFEEPEEDLFFTQQVIHAIADAAEGWTTLDVAADRVWTAVQEYETLLETDADTQQSPLERRLTRYDESFEQFVRAEVVARVLAGQYNNRRRTPHLANRGLVDVRLAVDVDTLDETKRELLAAFHAQGTRYVSTLAEEIEGAGHHVEELVDMGVLAKEQSDGSVVVSLSPDVVELTLTDATTPVQYDPEAERFYTTFDRTCRNVDVELVPFEADYQDRATFTHPHFDRVAYRIDASDPLMLLSDSYFGQTERSDRRRLEYQFREGRHPNFLSSGPAMEVGVDIGDLDSLLLYGTPPNTNSYLQRVGRAGRDSGASIVHSVSQRNPIDYYYFRQPGELIQSAAQPVPLNEANREVLHRSLIWAVLDAAASTRWIPWRREESAMDDLFVYDDDVDIHSRTDIQERPNDIVSFSTLLANACQQLQPGAEISPLEALRDLVTDDTERAAIERWLEDLLRYSACETCGRKHDAGYEGPCADPECSGTTVSMLDRHRDLVDVAIDAFEAELVDRFVDFEDELFEELDHVEDRISDLRRSSRSRRRGRQNEGDGTSEREELDRLRSRRTRLDEFLTRLGQMDFGEFLTRHSEAAFSLRSVGATVSYELIGEGFEPATESTLERDRGIALSELHPGAAYLHNDDETYVVTEVVEDAHETQAIKESVADAAICRQCGQEYDIDTARCENCDRRLEQLETIVPRRVRAYQASLPIDRRADGSALTPSVIYRSQGPEVQSTYAPVETEAVTFDSTEGRRFAIVTEAGERVGVIEHGSLRMRSSATQFFATYTGGGSDYLPTVFEVCGRNNCSGVIARTDETAYCLQNPEHDTSDSTAVRLATEFETSGVRLAMASEELEHTLAHGLRAALQYIGGVSVRKVPETIEEDGTFIYDGDEGGSGISVLLTDGVDGENPSNFQRATDIIAETYECDCEAGCPFCLYQYGCTNRNDPDSFAKGEVVSLLDAGLRLEPLAEGEDA
ncbi:DEAD/DEAH box helicase [Natronomonas sp. CBA1123]|uniref:DEAD/DEAH box helicase n=1 Tax=Natronomonas sp. CBA1123 TaxID=2668070 RepID=UPI0012EAD988|nr:DEAD/DEAH box helicase [Natronomonas sp. CBA1123]MUV85325.1 DEAD/DEAH box helicase [Natronomonas sp. CBA1123]